MIGLLKLGFDEGISAELLADALRAQAGDASTEALERLAALLEGFLRSVPDAIATALAMSKNPRCGQAVAFATGPILTYLFDEGDLVPEATFGPVGMLDDAYLVHEFVGALTRWFHVAAPSDATYDAPDAHAFGVVASLLPEGVATSLRRTAESTIQVAHALYPSGPGANSLETALQPEFRVPEALSAVESTASA